MGSRQVPVAVGAALGFLGVGLAAFGAHGLEGLFEHEAEVLVATGLSHQLEDHSLEVIKRAQWWATAAQYHVLHAIAIVAVWSALADRGATGRAIEGASDGGGARAARAAVWCFALGIVVFSGTLYAMALGAPRWFGAITPIGGLLLMAGWAIAAISAFRSQSGA